MFDVLENLQDYGLYMAITVSVLFIAFSGIFFGVTYYVMDITATSLMASDCVIENNLLMDNCQDLFSFAVYPFLALREVLVRVSFFFIFGLTIAMLMLGYRSGKSPAMMGIIVAFTAGLTYLAILLSNMYRTLIDNAVVRVMMTEFTVYNKIMLMFPWFTFFLGIFALALGIVNFQRTIVNNADDEQSY